MDFGMMRNDTHPPHGPEPAIGGRYHDHYNILKTLVVPLFVHLLAWGSLVLLEYGMAAWDYYSVGTYDRSGFGTISSTDESPSTVAATESTPLLGKSAETGLPIQDRRTERVSRAGTVARTTFVMLLTAVVLMALPIEFACPLKVELPGPLPDPAACASCIANGAMYSTFHMAWAFFGMSVTWILVELSTVSDTVTGASIIRLILGVADVALIATIVAMTLGQWAHYKQMGEDCIHGGGF